MLPIRCPRCDCDQVHLYVSSRSVLTVRCPQCDHAWSLDIAALPPDTQKKVERIIHQ
jgi:hypothetical protein